MTRSDYGWNKKKSAPTKHDSFYDSILILDYGQFQCSTKVPFQYNNGTVAGIV